MKAALVSALFLVSLTPASVLAHGSTAESLEEATSVALRKFQREEVLSRRKLVGVSADLGENGIAVTMKLNDQTVIQYACGETPQGAYACGRVLQ